MSTILNGVDVDKPIRLAIKDRAILNRPPIKARYLGYVSGLFMFETQHETGQNGFFNVEADGNIPAYPSRMLENVREPRVITYKKYHVWFLNRARDHVVFTSYEGSPDGKARADRYAGTLGDRHLETVLAEYTYTDPQDRDILGIRFAKD